VSGLAVDLYETNDELVVTAVVPGVKPDDIDITIQGEVLTIKGETRQSDTVSADAYHHRERWHGRFFRQIALPKSVKGDQADARFENGILTLRLPKAEEAKERRIRVQGAQSSDSNSQPQLTGRKN
jgi:HSP20 family protein